MHAGPKSLRHTDLPPCNHVVALTRQDPSRTPHSHLPTVFGVTHRAMQLSAVLVLPPVEATKSVHLVASPGTYFFPSPKSLFPHAARLQSSPDDEPQERRKQQAARGLCPGLHEVFSRLGCWRSSRHALPEYLEAPVSPPASIPPCSGFSFRGPCRSPFTLPFVSSLFSLFPVFPFCLILSASLSTEDDRQARCRHHFCLFLLIRRR